MSLVNMDVDHSINLKSGSIIQGKYEVLRCLGAGSMGMVYAVKHLDLQDRILAMKVLYSDVAKDEVQAARFKNEIVASYEVNHPNVVRAYDYFKEGELIAYTMEYVSGGDLADRLNDENLITIKDSIAMLKQMASGLAVIHKAGIIHRDLKPENILISSDGSIKITDFGIARTVKGPRLTDHGGIVGTFAYVSPEYLEYGKLDCRSDIYSIGVLAYEMIVGNAPHDCANVIESMHAKLSTDPREPYLLRKECPRALSDVVMKALARNPDNRFQSAEELYTSLTGINEDVGVVVKRVNGAQLSDKSVEVPVNKTQRKVADSEIANMIEGLKESLEGGSSGNYPERSYDSTIIKPHVINQPAVTISQGRLSAQRFKELQEDLGSRKVGFSFSNVLSWFSAIFTGLLTFIVGALVGLLALKHSSLSSFSYVRSMISHYFNVE